MQEEFHGIWNNGAGPFKQLYGWTPLNTNVWLPSLSELVGIDPNAYRDWSGTYYSAMQGLNTSIDHWTDAKGGTQFAYFKQYNASGGGQRIWNACNGKQTWLRSVNHAYATQSWRTTNASNMNTASATNAYAVLPAVVRKLKQLFIIPRKYDIIRKRQ